VILTSPPSWCKTTFGSGVSVAGVSDGVCSGGVCVCVGAVGVGVVGVCVGVVGVGAGVVGVVGDGVVPPLLPPPLVLDVEVPVPNGKMSVKSINPEKTANTAATIKIGIIIFILSFFDETGGAPAGGGIF